MVPSGVAKQGTRGDYQWVGKQWNDVSLSEERPIDKEVQQQPLRVGCVPGPDVYQESCRLAGLTWVAEADQQSKYAVDGL
jgi:hypothetical protein